MQKFFVNKKNRDFTLIGYVIYHSKGLTKRNNLILNRGPEIKLLRRYLN